jgi:hypothetical protein
VTQPPISASKIVPWVNNQGKWDTIEAKVNGHLGLAPGLLALHNGLSKTDKELTTEPIFIRIRALVSFG